MENIDVRPFMATISLKKPLVFEIDESNNNNNGDSKEYFQRRPVNPLVVTPENGYVSTSMRSSLHITSVACKTSTTCPIFICVDTLCAPSCKVERHPVYCFSFNPSTPLFPIITQTNKMCIRLDLDGNVAISICKPANWKSLGEEFDIDDYAEVTLVGEIFTERIEEMRRDSDDEGLASVGSNDPFDEDAMYEQGIVYD
eukprot:Tbor_TRINITY_DN2955_c0_g1::TRINITY_DN2955_c0_g1_i1::g.1142::m.1142